jgi:glycosyltransferase involved in cell wall biosynthesis
VHHVVRLTHNRGLANAFRTGLAECIKLGADIIVNTDADNQYCADDIPKLIEPILRGRADIVIGTRPIGQIAHFSPGKKILQKLGSWVVRAASGTTIEDAPSGFRAITREAAIRTHVFSRYTYTLETIIQAGRNGLQIECVPIRVNPDLRPSRLVKSTPRYVWRSLQTIVRIFALYRPFLFFAQVGAVPVILGLLLCARWAVLNSFAFQRPGHNLPSLVAAAVLLLLGFQIWILGFVADLLAVNRRLLDELVENSRRRELRSNAQGADAHSEYVLTRGAGR